MKKRWMINCPCMLIICIIVLTSGCVHSNEISSMGTDIDIDYDDIAAINYTYAQQELEKEGHRVKSHIDPNFHRDDMDYALFVYSSLDDQVVSEWTFLVYARTREDNTTYGKFSVTYFPVGKYAQDEKKAARHAEMVSDEVAQICNLTIDWDKVSWHIGWSDGTGSSTHI